MIEDDPAIVRFLERGLAAHGHRTISADNGEDGLRMAADESVDLVLLDIMLPRLDGHRVLERIRLRRSDLPVLMLTARDEVSHKVDALDGGADDYLTKPFDLDELLARIRALLRRARTAEEEVLRFADLSADPATREVHRGDRPIEVTTKEYELLEFFLRHPRQVLSRQRLFEHVRGSDFLGGSNLIDVHVMRLREKLEATGAPRLI